MKRKWFILYAMKLNVKQPSQLQGIMDATERSVYKNEFLVVRVPILLSKLISYFLQTAERNKVK